MRMPAPQAASFVVALSELIALLGAGADLTAIQQVFSQLCLFAGTGSIALETHGGALHANDCAVDAPEDARVLAESMRWHGLAALDVDWAAEPEDLLHLAHLLSERPTPEAMQEEPFDSRSHRLGCWHVVARMARDAATPSDHHLTAALETQHPVVVLAHECATPEPALVLAEMIVDHAAALVDSGDAVQVTHLMRDVMRAEEGASAVSGGSDDVRRVWTEAFARIATRECLALVARLLPRRGPVERNVLMVLARAGDTAAEVLIRRLLFARELSERRVLFDTIVHVRAGFRLLARCMDHSHWHVIRNAALLLGAMRARSVESVMARALGNPDARVRLAVVAALSEIASLPALALVETAMTDRDSAVRLRAFRSLNARPDYNISARSIAEAFEVERDADRQLDLLDALVAVPDTNIVPKLMHFCTPGHHRRFTPQVRMALLGALVRLRPTPAKPLLRLARHDNDPKIREQAQRLIGQPASVLAQNVMSPIQHRA